MLSHANLLAAVDNLLAIDPIEPGDNYLSFLPCGWIVEQALGITAALRTGLVVNFPEEPETVQHDLREIGPSIMLARAAHLGKPGLRGDRQDPGRQLAQTPASTPGACAWVCRARPARRTPWRCACSTPLAERLVFFPLRDQLGLSKLRHAYTGGAALGPDAFRFFRALGVNLKQVYGQTEIGGLSVVHRDDAVDDETVGQAIANTEVRISDEGEILSRSAALFLGYYKNPAGDCRRGARWLAALRRRRLSRTSTAS